jgi:hypothetical protein
MCPLFHSCRAKECVSLFRVLQYHIFQILKQYIQYTDKRNTEASSRNHLPWRSSMYYIFRMSVCSLTYPSHRAHVPYCYLWPVCLYHIFPRYLVNGTIFEKKLPNIKKVFWFSLQLLSETFLILRRIQRDMIINVNTSNVKDLYSRHILTKLPFPQPIFEKYSNIKFHENPSIGSRVLPCGQTDVKTGMRKLIVALNNFVNVSNEWHNLLLKRGDIS